MNKKNCEDWPVSPQISLCIYLNISNLIWQNPITIIQAEMKIVFLLISFVNSK